MNEFQNTIKTIQANKLIILQYSFEYEATEELLRKAAASLGVSFRKVSLNQIVSQSNSLAHFERNVRQQMEQSFAAKEWIVFTLLLNSAVPHTYLEYFLFYAHRWLSELGLGDESKQQTSVQVLPSATVKALVQRAQQAEDPGRARALQAAENVEDGASAGTAQGASNITAQMMRCFLLMQLDLKLIPSTEFFENTVRVVVDTPKVCC